MADCPELCTKYVDDLIKKHKLYDKGVLNSILKKHKNELSYSCLISLSNYYDYLEGLTDDNVDFLNYVESKYKE